MTNQASPQVPRPEPKCALLVMCVECGEGIDAPLPIDHKAIAILVAQRGWFMSVLSQPGQEPLLFGVLCTLCAQKVFPAELFKVAEERRLALLQASQAQPQGVR